LPGEIITAVRVVTASGKRIHIVQGPDDGSFPVTGEEISIIDKTRYPMQVDDIMLGELFQHGLSAGRAVVGEHIVYFAGCLLSPEYGSAHSFLENLPVHARWVAWYLEFKDPFDIRALPVFNEHPRGDALAKEGQVEPHRSTSGTPRGIVRVDVEYSH